MRTLRGETPADRRLAKGMIKLRTQRLLLRPVRDDDLTALHAVFSDVRAMVYWSTPPHTDIAQTAAFVAALAACPTEFAVEYQGVVIGKAGFWKPPEIGYILHPDHWGRGLAYEALVALVDHGFGTCGMATITADVDPRNARSVRLLERLGFRETGRAVATIEVGGEWCDSVYFALDCR